MKKRSQMLENSNLKCHKILFQLGPDLFAHE